MPARKSKPSKLLYGLIALLLCGLAIPLVQIIAMSFEGEMPVFQIGSPIPWRGMPLIRKLGSGGCG